MKIHPTPGSNVSRLEIDNADLRNRLVEATAVPLMMVLTVMMKMTVITKRRKRKTKKKRDSSSSSSSSIEISKQDVLKMLKTVWRPTKEKDEGTDEDEKRGRTVVFPKFPQPET